MLNLILWLLAGPSLGSEPVPPHPDPARSAAPAAATCASLGLDPVVDHPGSPSDSLRVLERYYVETGGVGGLGCWVHPHANGKDYVVTPWSWGEDPNPGHQRLIDETFQAQTDAYDSLSAIGTLDLGLYVVLNDVDTGSDSDPEAYWPTEGQCWIEAGPRAGFGAWSDLDFKGTLAHEIGHCFLMQNVPGYTPATYGRGTAHWWDESGAEFFGSVVYPSSDFEHESSYLFDMDGEELYQAYNAVVLLQHYANHNGNRAVLDLLIRLHAEGRSWGSLNAYLDGAGLDDFFHDFGTTHYRGLIPDPGGGYMRAEDWVAPIAEETLSPPRGAISLDVVPSRRLNQLQLTLPEGHDGVLWAGGAVGSAVWASAYLDGELRTAWGEGIPVRGECDNARTFSVFLTTLRAEDVRDVSFEYELSENNEDCEEEETAMAACQDAPAFNQCLVGTWQMHERSIQGMLGSDAPVNGRIYTTFFRNGAFIHRFDNLEQHSISVYRSGDMKMEMRTRYTGDVRGCATSINAPRLDGAAPLRTDPLSDRVVRSTYIRHANRPGNERVEQGLQAWYWPNRPAYFMCEGDGMRLDSLVYRRMSR